MTVERTGALGMVGNTPLCRLTRLADPAGAQVWVKLEFKNPTGSVKDRAALAMVEAAEAKGDLGPGATIVEPTSGNTGISLAMISAVRGYKCKLVLPDDMSVGRHHLLRAYGAELVTTPAVEGMAGAVRRAEELVRKQRRSIMLQQFENPANPKVHETTTGPEIWTEMHGELDAFVAGVGTGGTITGVGRYLRSQGSNALLVAVEPKGSAVLSGGPPGLHGIQGLGAGFAPPVLDTDLLDRVLTVSDPDALSMTERLGREEGFLVGPSSGANVWAAVQVARDLSPDQRVVTILCDGGERYLIA